MKLSITTVLVAIAACFGACVICFGIVLFVNTNDDITTNRPANIPVIDMGDGFDRITYKCDGGNMIYESEAAYPGLVVVSGDSRCIK